MIQLSDIGSVSLHSDDIEQLILTFKALKPGLENALLITQDRDGGLFVEYANIGGESKISIITLLGLIEFAKGELLLRFNNYQVNMNETSVEEADIGWIEDSPDE